MTNTISLKKITVSGSLVKYEYAVCDNLKKFFKTDTFFIQYDQDIENVPFSVLTIPFVNCMAALSWLADAVIFVDEIDATYYESFKNLKHAYSELHKAQLNGLLVPSIIKQNYLAKSEECLLLFGGGVDCHCSFLRNKKCITGVMNIYGWLKDVNDVNFVDDSDKINTEKFANKFGIKPYHVRSNFASQFNLEIIDKTFSHYCKTTYWYGFLHSMAFLSISSPIAWANGISNLMIASSYTKDRLNLHCGSFITTDIEFRFSQNGLTIHDGFELNRQEKVRLIVDYQKQIGRPYFIQACSFNDHNCCECEKCFRTVVDLIAEGVNPRDFGFKIEGNMLDHWKNIVQRNVGLWGVKKENYFYNFTRIRMRENYKNIKDREFVDWFLNFDFEKAKKEGLKRYYRQNFFSILKRKLHL